MQNNRKRNVIKERIRQEKERRERLLAEEEEQYEDVNKDSISEQIQQEHSEQPRNQREESVNVNLPKMNLQIVTQLLTGSLQFKIRQALLRMI
jgi:colicin import membrane protein